MIILAISTKECLVADIFIDFTSPFACFEINSSYDQPCTCIQFPEMRHDIDVFGFPRNIQIKRKLK